ncbi:hypothetical protein BDR04DRAFT_423964 [Suillus decipiens]|nr:hypothetical protein BDR04DRAFT_423964 [Suillus decipiens]
MTSIVSQALMRFASAAECLSAVAGLVFLLRSRSHVPDQMPWVAGSCILWHAEECVVGARTHWQSFSRIYPIIISCTHTPTLIAYNTLFAFIIFVYYPFYYCFTSNLL